MKHGNDEIYCTEILRLCGSKPEEWVFIGIAKAMERLFSKLSDEDQERMIDLMRSVEE